MRRHPMRGCDCPTCTNERVYAKTERRLAGNAEANKHYRDSRTEIQHAALISADRERSRARADRRDTERMHLLRDTERMHLLRRAAA